jgi:F-type H+-transporting ATPase subunit delta
VSVQARPQDYAKAIYDLALELWTRQLEDVQRALNQDAGLRAAMEDRKIVVGERLKRLDRIVPEGMNEAVFKFLGTLLEAGQIDELDAILVELDRLAHHKPELKLAQVTSAVALTAAEQEDVRTRLIRRFGPDLEFRFEVDESLIGGVRLRVGDQVIDGSVSGKLAAMRDRLVT